MFAMTAHVVTLAFHFSLGSLHVSQGKHTQRFLQPIVMIHDYVPVQIHQWQLLSLWLCILVCRRAQWAPVRVEVELCQIQVPFVYDVEVHIAHECSPAVSQVILTEPVMSSYASYAS
jgi:hypothetical protein